MKNRRRLRSKQIFWKSQWAGLRETNATIGNKIKMECADSVLLKVGGVYRKRNVIGLGLRQKLEDNKISEPFISK